MATESSAFPRFDLEGQVVLVTAAARGLGRACALACAHAGADIALGLRDKSSDSGITAEIQKLGRRVLPLQMDVSKMDQIQSAVAEAHRHFGKIDVLVNNAGIAPENLAENVVEADFDATLAVNLKGTFFTSQAVGRLMIGRRSGCIVNMSSQAGFAALPAESIYCASKAALHSLSQVLKLECAPFNIKVTVVVPGSVKSNIASNQGSTFRLPDSSLYTAFLPAIMKRMNISQTMSSMPTKVFARQMVDQTLKKNPPFWVSIGGNTWLWAFFTWIPRSWALWCMWRLFRR